MAKETSVYKYKSRFGSESSMINQEETDKLNDPDLVVLSDEFGNYVTQRCRLDTKLADPNRYEVSRLSKLFSTKKKDEKHAVKK